MRWLRLVLWCVLWLAWVRPALAHTVVLLRPPSRSPATTELLERLRGELLSIGFEVVVRPRAPSTSSSASGPWQSVLLTETDCDVVLDVLGDSTPVAVDVWVIDSGQHAELLTRVKVDVDSENYSKGLAIRVSEVLRARLLETHTANEQQRASAAAPPPSAQTVDVAARETQSARRLGFELGAVAFTSLDGVGPAISPLIRFDWAIESKLVLQTTLAGFGTRPSVVAPAGKAQIAMQYGLLGASYRLGSQGPVQPLAALSLGALHTAVDGQAEPPWTAHYVDQWSLLLDVSVGATFQLSRRYAMVLAGHAQLAQPYVAIHVGDQRVASSGRPNLLVSVTFGVWP